MLIEKTISIDDLTARYQEVLDEIHRDGVVYIVKTNNRDTHLTPVGLIDNTGEISFVLGPEPICGLVMGLVDAEYGWPTPVEAQDIKTAWDLSPGRRCHPFICRDSICLAVSIMIQEYEQIKQERLRESQRDTGSEGRP